MSARIELNLLPAAVFALLLGAAGPAKGQILLVGGSLPICTSMSPDQCQKTPDWPVDSLTGPTYRVERESVVQWALAQERHLDRVDIQHWLRLLTSLATDHPEEIDRQALTTLLRNAKVELALDDAAESLIIVGEDLYQQLDDREWWKLLDHFQVSPGPRREVVRLADSRNRDAVAIFEHFVAMAARRTQRERPLIAVSTASSRDPYDALEFYLQVFEQAGADVVWLPLDAAVRRARADQNCMDLARYQAIELGSFQRKRIMPERFDQQVGFCLDRDAGVELVAEIDGLFLNGGDQWLTLHAFRDYSGQASAELEVLLARLQKDEMVLGGTSAGSAVQSARNMISNGSNAMALLQGARAMPPPGPGCERNDSCPDGLTANHLTYHPPGGLATAPLFLIDTHFSERQRQLRLTRLLSDSGQRYGLGVDETTAVELDWRGESASLELKTIGAEGVWLLDRGAGEPAESGTSTIIAVHRLGHGDRIRFDPDSGLADQLSLSGLLSPGPRPEPICREISAQVSFNDLWRLVPASTDAAASCFTLALDDLHHARLRLHRTIPDHATTGDAGVLSITVESIAATASPDRDQQPDPTQSGTDESEQTKDGDPAF